MLDPGTREFVFPVDEFSFVAVSKLQASREESTHS